MGKDHPVQIGGVHQQMTELLSKYGPPTQIIILLVIGMGIVFLPKLPKDLARQSDTVYGRLIHLGLVYYGTQAYGYPVGILLAIFSALLISAGSNPIEGFNSDITIIDSNEKWFVEKVLGENPLLIEEENVTTYPVQSYSRRESGSYGNGGGVQNTSVSM